MITSTRNLNVDDSKFFKSDDDRKKAETLLRQADNDSNRIELQFAENRSKSTQKLEMKIEARFQKKKNEPDPPAEVPEDDKESGRCIDLTDGIEDVWAEMHYPAKRTMWSMFCFRFIQLLNIALIIGAIIALAFVILESIQHYREEKQHPSTVTSVVRSKILELPQIVMCSYSNSLSISIAMCQVSQRQYTTNWKEGKLCYNSTTNTTSMTDVSGICPKNYGEEEYNCKEQIVRILENELDDIFCYSINGPTTGAFAPYTAYGSGVSNSIFLTPFLYGADQPIPLMIGYFESSHKCTSADIRKLTTVIFPDTMMVVSLSKSQFISIEQEVTSYYSSSNTFLPLDVGLKNISYFLITCYYTMDVQTIREVNKYGLSNAVADIGGISGLMLGFKGLTLIAWLSLLFKCLQSRQLNCQWCTKILNSKVSPEDSANEPTLPNRPNRWT